MTLLRSSGRDCVQAWEAMPWVLHNSATQLQSEWLKAHLAQCESCHTEFAQQSRLRLAMSLPTDISVDANDGLRRLLSRLDMPDPQEVLLRSRSGNWFSRALIAVVLIQTIGIGALNVKSSSMGASPVYRTLSQVPLPAAPGTIRVVPDVTMKLADWSSLLRALQLEVVGGPNDVGAYTVAPTSSASTARHALQQLRATRGILLAEPVADTP